MRKKMSESGYLWTRVHMLYIVFAQKRMSEVPVRCLGHLFVVTEKSEYAGWWFDVTAII